MIEVTHYHNQPAEVQFESVIADSYEEVRGYINAIPEKLYVYFDDESSIIPETGIGGFAYSHDSMTLAIDAEFRDKGAQAKDLRGTVFHEAFHLAQHFTAADSPKSAIDAAIYEGCATVFEREYADIHALWGEYQLHSEDELKEWVKALKEVGDAYFTEDGVWEKWAFYNHDLQQRWIVYKTGTWIVDRVLRETGLGILDLQDKSSDEILSLTAL